MRAIFISYRRDDTEGHAGRLFEDLCDRFGRGSVFMDVAGIEPGRDFRRVIEQQVASCGVLLAMIGKDWLAIADAQGQRRLDDPNDFVRLETAHALKRDIPVIPVLVQNAAMPREEQLPADLKDLAFRNSVELTHARWNSDVQLLIDALLPYVDAAPPAAPTPAPAPNAPGGSRTSWLIAPLAVLAAGSIGYVVWDRVRDDAPGAPTPAASTAASGAGVVVAAAPAPAPVPAPAPAAAPTPVPAPVAGAPPPAAEIEHTLPAAPASAPATKPVIVAKPPPPAASRATPSPRPPSPAPAPAPAPATGPTIVAARQEPGLELLGSPGTPAMVTRTIVIKPTTSFVNVTGGEVIRFDVGDKSFVWNFNGQRSSFDLARVAPASVLERKVTAYVAPNPMYPRRN